MPNPFTGGGKVKYTPGRVSTGIDTKQPIPGDFTVEDALRSLGLERDLMAADMLENDKNLDLIEQALNDQMSGMSIPGGDDARRICGSQFITWECYKKAREMLKLTPQLTQGFDPSQASSGDRISKRKGPVIMNCRDFDPDEFAEQTDYEGRPVNGTSNVTTDPEDTSEEDTESLDDIMEKAAENQKSWALLMLFWDLIWGKPEMREPWLSQSKGENAELGADAALGSLPDIIRQERPWEAQHLKWDAFPTNKGPLDNLTTDNALVDVNNPNEYTKESNVKDEAAAIWIDPWEPLKFKDSRVKNRGLPVIKQGFLLSLLIAIFGLVPKIISQVFKLKRQLLSKFSVVKKIPVVGKKIFKVAKFAIAAYMLPVAMINNIFIEICIYLALLPAGSEPVTGDVPTTLKEQFPKGSKSGINNAMPVELKIQPTPGGFMPLDCLKAAQSVVNKVKNDAVNNKDTSENLSTSFFEKV